VSSTVRRAGAYALVGSLTLLAPALVGWGGLEGTTLAAPSGVGDLRAVTVVAVLPFLVLAAVAATVVDETRPVFDLLARPGDYEEGRLYGLIGLALALAGLAVVALQFGMALSVYVASALLLGYGNLAQATARDLGADPFAATAAFVAGGLAAGTLGYLAAAALTGAPLDVPVAVFVAASGALLGALLRSVLYERDDPVVLATVALALWLFADLPLQTGATQVVLALALAVGLGYVSYALETASITGMLTGVLLALLTVVLGNYGWFAVLVSFFGIGALSTRFRYEEKRRRGLAEDNGGARGSGNVLANSAVALAAVLGFAASPELSVPADLFVYAFAGSVAAAMSDTLSSEIGGLFDRPRLITTLETVPPGTDGGVTWQGGVAGLAGSGVVAAIATVLLPEVSTAGAVVVALAGFAGMVVDSLLGATVEGESLDNTGVNLLATLFAAVAGVGFAVAVGLVPG